MTWFVGFGVYRCYGIWVIDIMGQIKDYLRVKGYCDNEWLDS